MRKLRTPRPLPHAFFVTAATLGASWFGVCESTRAAWICSASADDPLADAESALQQRKFREAADAATKAIEQTPDRPRPYFVRGLAYAGLGRLRDAVADYTKSLERKPDLAVLMQRCRTYSELDENEKAIADIDQALALNPKIPGAYRLRGREQFKLGRVQASIADFDRFVELEPEHEIDLWERGLSRYYDRKFALAQKSFEDYHKFGSTDIENGLWRMISQAEVEGLAAAQKDLLQYEPKRRPPFPDLHDLYSGKTDPDSVLKHATDGASDDADRKTRTFYAELYVGLWYTIKGDKTRAAEHTEKAVALRSTDYMWYVARVHLEWLRKP
jgi:lipoprotein NlpI